MATAERVTRGMRVGRSLCCAAWALLASAGLGAAQPGPGATRPAERPVLTLLITGFANDRGQALVAVFPGAQGFPDQVRHAVWRKALRIERRAVRVTTDALRPGRYAVALVHDENSDFKLNTALFGIPREGFGASRDAPARFGPPVFDDAVFELKPAERKQLTIHVRYLRGGHGPRQH